MLGVERWVAGYATNPLRWLSTVGGGRVAARWRRSLGECPAGGQRWLRRLAVSPTGLHAAWLLACAPRAMPTLRDLIASGWAVWCNDARIEMPAARRHFAVQCAPVNRSAAIAAKRWIGRYLKVSLGALEQWNGDDRACLTACLTEAEIVAMLDVDELERAVFALRPTAAVQVATDALRRRLVTASVARDRLTLRRALGAAMIDIGAYSESLVLLQDTSRTSKVLRAHALLRRGEAEAGRRLLRELGPKRGDRNWDLQWALGAVLTNARKTDSLLRRQLETAYSPRLRGLVFSLYAEWEDSRGGRASTWYRRAIADLREAGDDIGTAWSRARLARALAREGKHDEAAETALLAWREARPLPGVAVRGTAALACVDTGLVARDGLRAALEGAALAELPDLARDAARALGPDPHAPILSLGAGDARVDGEPIRIISQGPTWRLLEFLCGLPGAPPVTIDDLFSAGWPGERASADSRRRRVHTAIWTLRRAGLRRALQTVDNNRYRLHARVISDEA